MGMYNLQGTMYNLLVRRLRRVGCYTLPRLTARALRHG